jgi:hypothetical protein
MHFNSYFQHCLLTCGALIAGGWMGYVAFRSTPPGTGLSIPSKCRGMKVLGRDQLPDKRTLGTRVLFCVDRIYHPESEKKLQ